MRTNQNSHTTAETKAVQEFYDTLNANDIEACLQLFDVNILRVEFEGTPMAGTFRGLTEMKAHLIKGRGSWAEGTCEPEELIVQGDKIIALVKVHVRLKDQTNWLEGRVGDVFLFANGKITEMRTFATPSEACNWAGIHKL